MTEVRVRTVDAFTDRPFTGNPAAVVVLESIPPDEWMAAVARETNLSDTGFVLRDQLPDADFRLRWVHARSCRGRSLRPCHSRIGALPVRGRGG